MKKTILVSVVILTLFATHANGTTLKCDVVDYGEQQKQYSYSILVDQKNRTISFNGSNSYKTTTWNDETIVAKQLMNFKEAQLVFTVTLNRVTGQFTFSKLMDISKVSERDVEEVMKFSGKDFLYGGTCTKATPLF